MHEISYEHSCNLSLSFHSCDRSRNGKFLNCIRKAIINFLFQWFEVLKDDSVSNSNMATFMTILWEAIKNASDHGNNCSQDKLIHVVIWAGKKGLMASVKDQGDFFKNSQTKFLLENKLPLERKWQQKTPLNSNMGMETIKYADKIFIDSENGIIYLVWIFK